MVTFKNILDRAYITLFTDYKLDKLAKIDEQAFYDFSWWLFNKLHRYI